jgi:Uncharacterized protein conserved in bacteria
MGLPMPERRVVLALAMAATLGTAACRQPEPPDAAPVVPPEAEMPPPATGHVNTDLTAEQIETATQLRPAPTPTAQEAPEAQTEGPGSVTRDGAPLPADPPVGAGQPSAPAREMPDPALIRVQILLDRTAFSPGVIDGYDGQNTRQAIAAWRQAQGLSGAGVDAALIAALAQASPGAVTQRYSLTEDDVSGPFSPPPGGDLAAQARDGTEFSSARERIAERFHIDEDLLIDLNPGVDFSRAGQTVIVPVVDQIDLPDVARIEVSRRDRAVRAFGDDGRLLAYYPATIGSATNPSPEGAMSVTAVAPNPNYTYDPRRLSWGPGGRVVVIPPGPNNPVGSTWIDLSKDTYGIHGTPHPSLVGKTASHGCVRLTNWDVEQLSKAVRRGTEVAFV